MFKVSMVQGIKEGKAEGVANKGFVEFTNLRNSGCCEKPSREMNRLSTN